MVEIIVKATNEKIQETLDAKGYTQEALQKAPHIAFVDEVSNFLYFFNSKHQHYEISLNFFQNFNLFSF
jgi:predicted ATPase